MRESPRNNWIRDIKMEMEKRRLDEEDWNDRELRRLRCEKRLYAANTRYIQNQ